MPASVFLPAQPDVISQAASWLAQLATGTLTSRLAMLAIAGLGFAMLQGRLSMRRAAQALLGCFILFSAHSLAAAWVGMAVRTDMPMAGIPDAPDLGSREQPPSGAAADPYAGASVPD